MMMMMMIVFISTLHVTVTKQNNERDRMEANGL